LEAKRLQTIEAEAQHLAEEKARLEELDRAKLAFIRLVTHELKAPISAISTYLDLILNDYIPPEGQREYLEKAQARAQEQIDLIADLLEFGKLKEIVAAKKAAPHQVEAILRQVLEESQSQAIEKGLQVTADISLGLPPACLPPDQIKSIWANLISNAVKYTPSGGQVIVRLRQQDGDLLGEVQDNGIGIPEESKDSLFTEFFRAQNAKALGIPGTGLGLAIIKQIIEKAGGKIWVESQIGQGSTFSFTLPTKE
jgi:signal transduction histidine kinase